MPQRSLSSKQRKLIKALPTTDSIAEAGREAGYGTKQAAHSGYKGIKERFPELLNRLGVTDEYLIEQVVKPGLAATKIERSSFMGSFQDERTDPDYQTRHKYLATTLALKGAIKNGNGDQPLNPGGGITIHLALVDSGRAGAIDSVVAARRGADQLIDVPAPVDADGR